jgi:ABC-type sugar transport system ATPase subunit
MHILSGVIGRDSGRIIFHGEDFQMDPDPRYSQQVGISTVYQELALAQNMTIMDNVFLWNMPRDAFGQVKQVELKQQTANLLAELGVELDPATPVNKLSVSEKQLVEITKALSHNASMIIMDEPNSALSPGETHFLFEIIRRLKNRGVTILFISHRIDEVFEISDRISVLRDGKLIGTLNKEEATVDGVISMMVGRELKRILYTKEGVAEDNDIQKEEALSVRNLSMGKEFQNVSFTLHKGEIFGVFGLVGAGRTQLAEAIFGLRKPDSGEVLVDGKTVQVKDPAQAVHLGIGFVPEDRKNSGIFQNMAVEDNINITSFDQLATRGWIHLRQASSQALKLVKNLDLRLSSLAQRIGSLSGGNQQKAILARWLAVNPHILIMDEPTRGIDVGAKAQIYEIIHQMANRDIAILLISSEIEEIMAVSDTIMVLRRGAVSTTIRHNQATTDSLMKHAA